LFLTYANVSIHFYFRKGVQTQIKMSSSYFICYQYHILLGTLYIYTYAFSRCFYPKRLTTEEYYASVVIRTI